MKIHFLSLKKEGPNYDTHNPNPIPIPLLETIF